MSTANVDLSLAQLMAMPQSDLVSLWGDLPSPAPGELAGEYEGHIPLGGLSSEQQDWARAQMCDESSERGFWLGKGFDGAPGLGEGYNIWRKAGGRQVRNVRFRTEMSDDAHGRGPALLMTYSAFDNLPGGLDLVDLVRRASTGVYLGLGFRLDRQALGPIPGASTFVLSGPVSRWVGVDDPTAEVKS